MKRKIIRVNKLGKINNQNSKTNDDDDDDYFIRMKEKLKRVRCD